MDETLKITLSLWGWDWNSLMSSQSPVIFSKLKVVFCLCNAKRSIHKTTLLSLYVFAIKNPGTRLTDKSRKRSNFGLNQVIYLCFAIKNKLKVCFSLATSVMTTIFFPNVLTSYVCQKSFAELKTNDLMTDYLTVKFKLKICHLTETCRYISNKIWNNSIGKMAIFPYFM